MRKGVPSSLRASRKMVQHELANEVVYHVAPQIADAVDKHQVDTSLLLGEIGVRQRRGRKPAKNLRKIDLSAAIVASRHKCGSDRMNRSGMRASRAHDEIARIGMKYRRKDRPRQQLCR